MKKIILFFCILPLLSTTSCNNDDNNNSQNPASQLPEATQVGANTAGCLVNGEVLLPQGVVIGANLVCFYQLINGEYFFSLGYGDNTNDPLKGINVFTSIIQLEEGETYILQNPDDNTISGGGGEYSLFSSFSNPIEYNTNSTYSGELTITRLDTSNSIISGTFWFDAVNTNDEVIEVREGRFDMQYSN